MSVTRHSPEYHSAHLAFSRSTITQAAAEGRPILDLLKTYTEDVKQAERDSHAGAVAALEQIVMRATAVGVGTPCYPLARALGQIAADALDRPGGR